MSKFKEYRLGDRVYFYYNDDVMVKYAEANHKAHKVFGVTEDWSQGSWGVDFEAFKEMLYAEVEDWVVKVKATGEVWTISLRSAMEYGIIRTLHPSDGEQLFVPLTRFDKLEEK